MAFEFTMAFCVVIEHLCHKVENRAIAIGGSKGTYHAYGKTLHGASPKFWMAKNGLQRYGVGINTLNTDFGRGSQWWLTLIQYPIMLMSLDFMPLF
jgi:hypothetical protein